MSRGRIKKILLPYLVKHTLLALIGTSLLFICYLMFKLVTTLTKEISLMSDHHHQLTTEQVLFYIKNFLMFVLFGSLQSFGIYGVIRTNRNILVAYVSSLIVAFVFTLIDHLLNSGYLLVAIYLLAQALLTYAYLTLIQYKRQQISNIHYIPMPNDDISVLSNTESYKYFRI